LQQPQDEHEEVKDEQLEEIREQKYPNGDLYVGGWKDNKPHGMGTFKSSIWGVYVGNF